MPAAAHPLHATGHQLATARQLAITQARHALLGGGPPRADGSPALWAVEPWIVRSWQRCLASGRQPHQRVDFDPIDASVQRRSAEQHRTLLHAAGPVLAQLARAIAGMHYFALLTDAHGVVVGVEGASAQADPRARAIARVGVNLSEAAAGTTAIGAALAEQTPVWLHRGEHFYEDNMAYSCAGAPLLDPQGRCVGMLDLTGVDVPERPELRHLVARSARAVEDALLLQCPHALLLRLNWPGSPLGGDSDGLLVLDEDGCVLGCNSVARQLMPQPLHTPGAPAHASDLLAMRWSTLFDTARRHPGQPIDLPLWSGLRLQAMAQLPRHIAHAGRAGRTGHVEQAEQVSHADYPGTNAGPALPAALPAAAPLREAETALIRQAVQDARGNVAQAARALGISRATVYRKLGQHKGPASKGAAR
jgi:sigma-54 dependent transcriptional regulator, acetoin dehydrogenase operon transcriptional activator AcoR